VLEGEDDGEESLHVDGQGQHDGGGTRRVEHAEDGNDRSEREEM